MGAHCCGRMFPVEQQQEQNDSNDSGKVNVSSDSTLQSINREGVRRGKVGIGKIQRSDVASMLNHETDNDDEISECHMPEGKCNQRFTNAAVQSEHPQKCKSTSSNKYIYKNDNHKASIDNVRHTESVEETAEAYIKNHDTVKLRDGKLANGEQNKMNKFVDDKLQNVDINSGRIRRNIKRIKKILQTSSQSDQPRVWHLEQNETKGSRILSMHVLKGRPSLSSPPKVFKPSPSKCGMKLQQQQQQRQQLLNLHETEYSLCRKILETWLQYTLDIAVIGQFTMTSFLRTAEVKMSRQYFNAWMHYSLTQSHHLQRHHIESSHKYYVGSQVLESLSCTTINDTEGSIQKLSNSYGLGKESCTYNRCTDKEIRGNCFRRWYSYTLYFNTKSSHHIQTNAKESSIYHCRRRLLLSTSFTRWNEEMLSKQHLIQNKREDDLLQLVRFNQSTLLNTLDTKGSLSCSLLDRKDRSQCLEVCKDTATTALNQWRYVCVTAKQQRMLNGAIIHCKHKASQIHTCFDSWRILVNELNSPLSSEENSFHRAKLENATCNGGTLQADKFPGESEALVAGSGSQNMNAQSKPKSTLMREWRNNNSPASRDLDVVVTLSSNHKERNIGVANVQSTQEEGKIESSVFVYTDTKETRALDLGTDTIRECSTKCQSDTPPESVACIMSSKKALQTNPMLCYRRIRVLRHYFFAILHHAALSWRSRVDIRSLQTEAMKELLHVSFVTDMAKNKRKYLLLEQALFIWALHLFARKRRAHCFREYKILQSHFKTWKRLHYFRAQCKSLISKEDVRRRRKEKLLNGHCMSMISHFRQVEANTASDAESVLHALKIARLRSAAFSAIEDARSASLSTFYGQ